MKNNLSFDVSKTPEGILCIELQGVINRLREEVKAQKKSDVHVQTSSMDKKKGKRRAKSAPSPVSEDEG